MSDHRTIRILQLYPKDMNIYGDWGNVLVLKRRLEWRGLEPELVEYNVGDAFPENIDIIVGGGGQDSGQSKIQDDLLALGPTLIELANNGTPMLLICGLYQMFGHRFITHTGDEIRGIGLLDVETVAGPTRLIGNVVADSPEFGMIVGYENHSGQTTLGPNAQPLATVRLGAGNNERGGHEGARYRNVIGSYLHGSLLPKNPSIADWLIKTAATNRFGDFDLKPLDDNIVELAREVALKLPR